MVWSVIKHMTIMAIMAMFRDAGSRNCTARVLEKEAQAGAFFTDVSFVFIAIVKIIII